MTEFYISLLSDSSSDMFPNNKISSFQTHLPQPINLESNQWCVGLAEISYPAGLDSLNIPVDFNKVVDKNILMLRGVNQITFSPKTYDSILKLYNELKSKIKTATNESVLDFFMLDLQKTLAQHHMEINRVKLAGHKWKTAPVVSVSDKFNTITVDQESISFPVRVYNGIGDLANTIKNSFKNIATVEKVNEELYTEVSKDLRSRHGKVTPCTYMLPLDTEPVFVYTDIIESQIVGNMYTRCLRVIQFPSKEGHHMFNNIYYVPVEKSSFQTIAVELLTKFGQHALFSNSVKPCLIVLHFKKYK